jgi:hypothetical protein
VDRQGFLSNLCSALGFCELKEIEKYGHTMKKGVIRTIKRRKANWIGHILRRNCLLKHILESKQRYGLGMRRQGRRRKQLPNDLKEM